MPSLYAPDSSSSSRNSHPREPASSASAFFYPHPSSFVTPAKESRRSFSQTTSSNDQFADALSPPSLHSTFLDEASRDGLIGLGFPVGRGGGGGGDAFGFGLGLGLGLQQQEEGRITREEDPLSQFGKGEEIMVAPRDVRSMIQGTSRIPTSSSYETVRALLPSFTNCSVIYSTSVSQPEPLILPRHRSH
jgi:hypothetical protein